MVDVAMLEQKILVLFALLLTACVGASAKTANLSKPRTRAVCSGLTGVSAQYSVQVAGLPVRCGSQSEFPIT